MHGSASWRRGWPARACALVLALAAAVSWPAAAARIELRDDRGVTHAWLEPPRRIVSLLPSLTETVCTLGACKRLVGVDRFSNWPAEVRGLPQLGGLDDAQLERIVALRPDVVLASTSARVLERLEALGLKAVALDSASHADVRRSFDRLGRLLGDEEAAARQWAAVQAGLEIAAQRVPAGLRGRRIYFEIGSTPHAAGPGSFIGETLARMGLVNIVPAGLGAFPRLNPEFVLRAQPDIVVARSADLAQMASRPGWDRLEALAHRRTCGFDDAHYEVLVRPGPRLGEAALQLAACLSALGVPDRGLGQGAQR